MLLKLTIALGLLPSPSARAQVSAVREGATTIPSASNSINPGANEGKKSQDSGSAANMAAAAALAAAAMATQPPNMGLLMMAAMAAMQGGADKDAASQSGATANTTATGGSTTTNPTATTPTYADATAGTGDFGNNKVLAAGMKALKDAGYTASPAGITSASGVIPASAFSSSGSMLAAGIDPKAVKEGEKVAKDVAAAYGTVSVATDSGGGGGSSSAPANDANESEASVKPASLINPFLLAADKKAEMMVGKTVTLDGEPIGVKGNDIFQMVHLAYARKRAGNHFIETDHDPALGARAPASVTTGLSPVVTPAAQPKK